MTENSIHIDIKELPKDTLFDMCLLENNEKQIQQICSFLNGDKNLLLLNGFSGCGKSQITNFISKNVNNHFLVLKYRCFETTVLDDMLLSFFDSFHRFTIQGKIQPPKMKTENFTQKINSYFSGIFSPILVIINSFDEILKPNKPEVLNFILHLTTLQNVKIILTSKVFDKEDFESISYESITALALTKSIFEKHLKNHGIKQIGILSNELYKQTKGYYQNVCLSENIITLKKYNLGNFLGVFSKSYVPFVEFLYREGLTTVDPSSIHLFRLLAMMRIPLSIKLIQSLNLYNEEKILHFIKTGLILVDNESLYLDSKFIEIIEKQIPESSITKIHKACLDLYNVQLPLKPLERDLKLSRQTMRNEIDYHSRFLPKKFNPLIIQQDEKRPIISQKTADSKEETPQKIETKEEKIKNINFIIEDEQILDDIADSIKDYVSQNISQNIFMEQSNDLSLTDLLNQARQEEAKYNYKYAVLLYQKALTKKDEEIFYKFLPTIYVSLGRVYKNLSKWYEAIESYTQAQDFFYNVSDEVKLAQVKLEIANIYFRIYKTDNAKFILKELKKNTQLPNDIRAKTYLALGNLEQGIDISYSYYSKAISLVDLTVAKNIQTELYYKFAGLNDEKNNIKKASEYYQKCIDADSNPKTNPYLSRAYTGLAEIYDENGQTEAAIEYYGESINIDTITNNKNGLYISARHIAEIYKPTDPQKTLEYLNKSYEYATQLGEAYYISDTSVELGKFYMVQKNYENAYKYLFESLKIEKQIKPDLTPQAQKLLEEIQKRVSSAEYLRLQDKYGK